MKVQEKHVKKMSMVSLLLLFHESEGKLRVSVNNRDIIPMYLGYNYI